jgi:hypothetical protein
MGKVGSNGGQGSGTGLTPDPGEISQNVPNGGT